MVGGWRPCLKTPAMRGLLSKKGGNSEAGGRNGLWGTIGWVVSLILSISDSLSRLSFARRFWNQIFTWVSVRFNEALNSARSAILRYCFSLNFFSSARSCWVVKGVLGLRLGLCLRSVTLMGTLKRGISGDSVEGERENTIGKRVKDG